MFACSIHSRLLCSTPLCFCPGSSLCFEYSGLSAFRSTRRPLSSQLAASASTALFPRSAQRNPLHDCALWVRIYKKALSARLRRPWSPEPLEAPNRTSWFRCVKCRPSKTPPRSPSRKDTQCRFLCSLQGAVWAQAGPRSPHAASAGSRLSQPECLSLGQVNKLDPEGGVKGRLRCPCRNFSLASPP